MYTLPTSHSRHHMVGLVWNTYICETSGRPLIMTIVHQEHLRLFDHMIVRLPDCIAVYLFLSQPVMFVVGLAPDYHRSQRRPPATCLHLGPLSVQG